MTNVQTYIEKDARKQMIAGGVLVGGALIFFMGLFTFNASSILLAILYSGVFAISGSTLLRKGYLDLQKSRNTTIDFNKDQSFTFIEKVPARMFVGRREKEFFKAELYDMAGESYGKIEEESPNKRKNSFLLAALLSYGSIRPADYTMTDQEGNRLYRIEKKGGFTWRGYVQNDIEQYVAYTESSKDKATGQRVYHYIEKEGCRWSAAGDEQVAHFKIKDASGKDWAVLKSGAVPVEAAERFSDIQGSVIEWKIREEIPNSLMAFVFLLQTRYQI
ncbi:hypothetical protein [Halobacillus mangrovi]|uniref:Uncharacterized protein n=1 Tax=Halobacillus mangrovi TaxID=402384 RepID=A0A1W5ZTH4_9BACI|nr:hypothetical protein [Halobacillus mangrovi]ARI76557.1 hypothetical protein HM131_06790 [Halobacillus mangrovi]